MVCWRANPNPHPKPKPKPKPNPNPNPQPKPGPEPADLDGVLAYALIDLESGAPSFTPWEHMTTDLEPLGGIGRRWEALG